MKIASLADVKAKFSAYVTETGRGPVVITRNGKAVAAMIPLADDEEVERIAMAYSPRLRQILAAARQRIDSGEGVGHDEFWRRVKVKSRLKAMRKPAIKRVRALPTP